MSFNWNWCSSKGRSRPENQDCAGIALGGSFLVAVVADGVFSRPRSGELAKALVSNLVNRVVAREHPPESDEVRQWIEDAFHELKSERAPKSSSSFIVATFARDQLLFTVHAGDCRVGTLTPQSDVYWRTPVHSVATAFQALPESELCVHPARNQLTRTFGTKRCCTPEILDFRCAYPGGAVLATDGYWAELPTEFQKEIFSTAWKDQREFEDDVSRLTINWGALPGKRTNASENLYVRDVS